MFEQDEYKRRRRALEEKLKEFAKILMDLKPGQAEKLIEDDYKEIEQMKEPNARADLIFKQAEELYREAEEDKNPWIGKYTGAVNYLEEAVILYRKAGDAKGEIKALEKIRDFLKKYHQHKALDDINSQIDTACSKLDIE